VSEMITGYEYGKGETLILTIRPCPSCRQSHKLTVNQFAFENWADRFASLEEAFPELTPAQRELLLTGIDGECWDKAVPEGDDDEQGE
jgi:hypothetical protein